MVQEEGQGLGQQSCLWQQLLLAEVVVKVVLGVVEELGVWAWSFSEAVWGSAREVEKLRSRGISAFCCCV